jgi:hypothetical protein
MSSAMPGHAICRWPCAGRRRPVPLPVAAGAAGAAGAKPARASLTLSDDGVGIDPAQAHDGHCGLQGMHGQAAVIGGQIEVRSQPGQAACTALSDDA